MSNHGGFLTAAARIVNGRQANVVVMSGNTGDVFAQRLEESPSAAYQPLPQLVGERWSVPGRIVVVAELNGPLRLLDDAAHDVLAAAWVRWRCGLHEDPAIAKLSASPALLADMESQRQHFDQQWNRSTGQPTLGFEWLRQLCACSRATLDEDFIIVIEAADLLIPDAPITQLGEADRRRLSVCLDWFSDPDFSQAADVVVLVAETMGALHQRVRSLPMLAVVDVPHPDQADRFAFIQQAAAQHSQVDWSVEQLQQLATATAGMSLLAIRQLLRAGFYQGQLPTAKQVSHAVEHHIRTRLGDDVVEFARPSHSLEQVIGFQALKTFLREEVMPRFRAGGEVALTGAAVAGPIGAGKTFLFEAFAAELDLPVLVLKNIRSQWFGGTDVIIEQLKQVLQALERVVILVDEADTVFGSLTSTAHATERRLVGKIQAMMSDTTLRGQVFWLLMTARVHLLSPDIRRPGRVGDLIVPVLDPTGPDRRAFLTWMLAPAQLADSEQLVDQLMTADRPASAAEFAALRSEIAAQVRFGQVAPTLTSVSEWIHDRLSPDIEAVRRYQALHAKVNCTRRQLLPDEQVTPALREAWHHEITQLEAQGIR